VRGGGGVVGQPGTREGKGVHRGHSSIQVCSPYTNQRQHMSQGSVSFFENRRV